MRKKSKNKFKTAVKITASNLINEVESVTPSFANSNLTHNINYKSQGEVDLHSTALRSEGRESPNVPTLHEDSSAQIRAEVINHSWLLVFIALLFLAAVGVAVADDWASAQTSLFIPPFVVPTLKYIEGGLFISGILFAFIYGVKTFRHVLMKGIQELIEIIQLLKKFWLWFKNLFH